MKLIPVLLLFLCHHAYAQSFSVTGTLTDERNKPIRPAEIKIKQKDAESSTATTNWSFTFKSLKPGIYNISITAAGFEDYTNNFRISDANVNLGRIILLPANHILDEVSIVEKVLAMVQKDDTLEFNSGAYKVNPDADAAELISKMPTIQINDKQITAQGENVVKVLVDGKPFFGNDPYASLKNLPADIIDKVQVYNEKSDQEQFTGFSEGNTSKTVNIITKPG